jgi:hypothetical protein
MKRVALARGSEDGLRRPTEGNILTNKNGRTPEGIRPKCFESFGRGDWI